MDREQELREPFQKSIIEQLRDFRKIISDLQVASIRNLEKALLTLAGGSLALSIGFIHQIAPSPKYLWLLIFISWPLLIISILTNLLCLRFQQRVYMRSIFWLGEAEHAILLDKKLPKPENTTSEKFMGRFADISIISFVVGLIILTLFCSLNLRQTRQYKMENIPSYHQVADSLSPNSESLKQIQSPPPVLDTMGKHKR